MTNVVIREAWDAALTTYEGWNTLVDLENAMGEMADAEGLYSREKKTPESYERLLNAERDNWVRFAAPCIAACAALIATPAPTLAEVRQKMELVAYWNLGDDELPRPVYQILADDIERLTGVRT